MDLSPKDLDLMTRTILSEAGPNASASEQAAIAHTILNRIGNQDYAPTISGVIRQKGAFEPWSLPRQGPGSENHPSKWDAKSAPYQSAAAIASGAASGSIDDPTQGADHFLQPETVQQRVRAGKMAWPSWAQGQGQRIGQHTFYQSSTPPAGTGGPSTKDGEAFLDQEFPQPAKAVIGPRGIPQITVNRQGAPSAKDGEAFLDQEFGAPNSNDYVAQNFGAMAKPSPPPTTIAGIPVPSAEDTWNWAKKNIGEPELAGGGAAAALAALAVSRGKVWPLIKYGVPGNYLTGDPTGHAARYIWDMMGGNTP